MAFKYRERNPDAWEKRANQQGADFISFINPDYKTFTAAKGDNFIRILPPTWEGADHYGLDVYAHYGIGPDRGSVLCLQKMKNQKCPICEAAVRAQRAGDEELFKELSARKRVLVWMLDRKDERKGPMIWSMPWSLDRDFCKLSRDASTGEIYAIDHPEEGFDISFDRQGESLTTKYVGSQIARRASSVNQDFLDFIEEEPLDRVLTWMTYAEIKELYEGGADGEERPEDRSGDRTRESRRDPPRENRRDPPREEPHGEAPQSRAGREEEAERSSRERTPPPAEEKPTFKRRGSGTSQPPPPKDPDDDGYTQPKAHTNGANGQAREEPPREREPAPAATGGRSRAEELRERFKR